MGTLIAMICIMLIFGVTNIVCLVIGAKVGQAVKNGEKIDVSMPNPIEAIRAAQDRKEAQREQDRLDVIMRNIDSYDGTGNGQQDVPRG